MVATFSAYLISAKIPCSFNSLSPCISYVITFFIRAFPHLTPPLVGIFSPSCQSISRIILKPRNIQEQTSRGISISRFSVLASFQMLSLICPAGLCSLSFYSIWRHLWLELLGKQKLILIFIRSFPFHQSV